MHDIEKSQELAKQEEKFVIKKALDTMAKKLEEVAEKVSNFQINQGVLAGRIYDLEEKERQRSRDEFQREQSLDFKNSEGLGEY